MDRRVQDEPCAIWMVRLGVGVENDEDVFHVDDQLHACDDLWRPRYYDYRTSVNGS